MFLLYLLLFLFLTSSKAFAEEDFFLVFISEKDKTAKIAQHKTPSIEKLSGEYRRVDFRLFLSSLQQEQEKTWENANLLRQ